MGKQYKGGALQSSHAEEHGKSGATAPYDSFIRGWIGTGRDYPESVIHFAPNIPRDDAAMFDMAFSTLEMFRENGATGDTVVRAFGAEWEQPLSNIISDLERSNRMNDEVNDNRRETPQEASAAEPRPATPIVLQSKGDTERMKEITDKLEQGIQDLFESDRYKEYLSTMSKFYNYSFNNTVLIAMQKPDATLVAGYTSWKKNFDRHVKEHEKSIKIIAPAPYKDKVQQQRLDPDTQEPVLDADGNPVKDTVEIQRTAFKVVSVFDVSQTEGRELPDIMVDELTGDIEQYETFWRALKEVSPVPVELEKIDGPAHGYYHLQDRRIAVDDGMSEIQTIKTAIHEIAHAKLHALNPDGKEDPEKRKDQRTREVEAESVAYTVCQHYGIETSDYSFGYIAGWSSGKETQELKGSLQTIRDTAKEMIEGIDAKFRELTAERQQGQEAAIEAQESRAPVFKLEANPRSESEADRFLVQQYLPSENGKVTPDAVLYVGTAERCADLCSQLKEGTVTPTAVRELYDFEKDSVVSVEKSVVTPKTAELDKPVEAASVPKHRLTSEEKEIQAAVMDVLKGRIAQENDGMLSQYRVSPQSHRTMLQYNVRITGDTVTRDGEPLFRIQHRYAECKTNGCYRQLNPKLEYIQREKAQEKPSICERLRAAAKSQPEQKAPSRTKSHELELG